MRKTVQNQAGYSVFRRWAGKGYAVFRSLKRVVKIGCLVVVYLRFANPGVVQAQVAETGVLQSYDLEAIDVTGEAMPETYSDVARVVVTIGQREIERAAVSSVSELLEYASNIDIRQRGTHGMQADVSVRGGSFDQVLILLNGVNITDPQTGHHNLNLPLDLSSIERIEVLKGPGAWRFGPGAFSGAINIVTKTGDKPFLQLGAELGSFRYNEEKASLALKHKNFSHLLSLNRMQTAGFVDNTDFKSSSVFYNGRYANGNQLFSVQFGYSDKAFGANSFYSAKYPNQYEEVQTLFSSIGYKVKAGQFVVEPKVFFRRGNDRFLLFRDRPELYSNFHTTETWGTNLLANYFHNAQSVTTMGLDTRTETIWSNNLGEIVAKSIISPVNDTILLNRFHSRSQLSVFFGHKLYLGPFTLNAAVNFTRHSGQGLDWHVYPGFDASWQIAPQSSLYASVNKTMRMPTYTDLYYQSPNNQGNPSLKPEEALGFELGYQYKSRWIDGSVTAFQSRGSNMIDWVKETTDQKWQTVNYTNLNTTGVELAAKSDFQKASKENLFFRTISLAYTYMLQDKPDQELISNYALNFLKHRFDLSLDHSIWKGFSGHWHLAWQDRAGVYEKFADQQSVGLTYYEPFFLVDLKVSWQTKGWNLYASVNNLFDTAYYDYGNVEQPGRWIKAGFIKKFDFHPAKR